MTHPAAADAPAARPYFNSLTALRYFAALAILMHHSIGPFRLPEAPDWFVGFRGTPVSFFFVLSGFVLAMSMGGISPRRWGDYYYRRFARIVPLYWAAAGLATYAWLATNRWPRAMQGIEPALGGLPAALALHLGMLQAWVPNMDYVFFLNAPAWTLSVEAFFYAVLPLLLLVPTRWLATGGAVYTALVWTGAILIGDAFGGQTWGGRNVLTHFFPPARLPEFIAGIIAARAVLAMVATPTRHPGGLALIGLGLIAGWCLSLQVTIPLVSSLGSSGLSSVFYESCGLPVFAMAIFLLARAEMAPAGPPLILRILGCPPLVLLGNASYAIYLLHVPLRIAIPPRMLRAEEAFPVYLAGIHVLAIAAYLFLEIPARRALIALRPSSRALPRPPAPAQP